MPVSSIVRATLLVAAMAAISSAGAAEPKVGRIDADQISRHVRILADDRLKGRAAGASEEAAVVQYIAEQLRSSGLIPAGDVEPDGRSWFQRVELDEFRVVEPGRSGLAIRGARDWALRNGEDVAYRTMKPVPSVQLEGAPIVFAGFGISAPDRGWNDYAHVDVRGKVVVLLSNDPDFEAVEGKFDGPSMTYYGRWTYKYEEAARQGAVAVLVIHEEEAAGYGWNVVRNMTAQPQMDIQGNGEAHALIEGWLHRDAATELFRQAGLEFDSLRIRARSPAFRPVELEGLHLAADYRVTRSSISTRNVLGVVRGRKDPDQTIIITAHWDAHGVGPPDETGDVIYNGALDNASGVGDILELARVLAPSSPERSIMFIATTAEEKGLLGSAYYVRHPLTPLETTAAVINIDTLSAWGPAADVSVQGSGKVSLEDDLDQLATASGRKFVRRPDPAGVFYRSDHFPFAQAGVPSISLASGRDLLRGGTASGEAARDAYIRQRYHQPSDEWSPDLDFSGQVEDLELVRRMVERLSRSSEWPTWRPDAEFRVIRQASDRTRGAERALSE